FDTATTTRADVRIGTPESGSYAPAHLIFTITPSDAITSLSFVNGDGATPTVAVGANTPVTSAAGAIVSFNGVTGVVSSIIPYAANRSVAPPVGKEEGDSVVYHGHFPVVLGPDGKNLAPNGASVVKLDPMTGKLLSLQ